MNNLKEEKSTNYDAAELVGRELQSPYRASSIPVLPPRPQKQQLWLQMTLTFAEK
jgi:hypothetical protein